MKRIHVTRAQGSIIIDTQNQLIHICCDISGMSVPPCHTLRHTVTHTPSHIVGHTFRTHAPPSWHAHARIGRRHAHTCTHSPNSHTSMHRLYVFVENTHVTGVPLIRHTCTRTHAHTHTLTHTHTHTHGRTHTYTHTQGRTYTYTHTCMLTHTHTHTHTHLHAHVNTHTYTHTCTHTHTRTHIYTHM